MALRIPDLVKKLARPDILFYALPWLMVLLVAGTIAQRDLGIFTAQKLFFSSWILWLGPLPLPGTYITLGLITLCLLAKFLFYSPWKISKTGTILSHLGVLVLLLGGILTAFSQQEGFIVIGEGQSRNAVSDYHVRVVTIEKDENLLAEIPFQHIKSDSFSSLPFQVSIEDRCTNCRPVPVKDQKNRHGLAQKVELCNGPPEKEDEGNLSGLTLSFSGIDKKQDGIYVMMEEIPHKPSVSFKGSDYVFSVGRAKTILPFEIQLNDFKKDMHPGTDMAKGFSSDVTIRDGDVEWPYRISMNEPLRYKGYTFYQSSFSLRPDGEYSVLSVVQNKGRVFPYIASAIIFLGLFLHVVIRLKKARS